MKAKEVMEEIRRKFKLKKGKIEAPESYLEARLRKKTLNGLDMWTMSSYDYVVAAVNTVKKTLKDSPKWKLPND